MPGIPTPVISLHNCQEGNLLHPNRILVHMDNIQILRDDPSLDISFALSAVFSLFYVFGVEYPKGLKKTMLFLERYVFKMNLKEAVPITVKRVYNAICD